MQYRFPSVKAFVQAGFSVDQGEQCRAIMAGTTKTTAYETVQAWLKCSYNKPSLLERKLCALNEILDGEGVEALYKNDDLLAEYVNLGETYATTLVYNYRTDTFLLGSYGYIAERYHI